MHLLFKTSRIFLYSASFSATDHIFHFLKIFFRCQPGLLLFLKENSCSVIGNSSDFPQFFSPFGKPVQEPRIFTSSYGNNNKSYIFCSNKSIIINLYLYCVECDNNGGEGVGRWCCADVAARWTNWLYQRAHNCTTTNTNWVLCI